MRDLSTVPDALPPGEYDPDIVRQAKVFEPGDPLPNGALAFDLLHRERGVFQITDTVPRVAAGSLVIAPVAMRTALWEAITGQPGRDGGI